MFLDYLQGPSFADRVGHFTTYQCVGVSQASQKGIGDTHGVSSVLAYWFPSTALGCSKQTKWMKKAKAKHGGIFTQHLQRRWRILALSPCCSCTEMLGLGLRVGRVQLLGLGRNFILGLEWGGKNQIVLLGWERTPSNSRGQVIFLSLPKKEYNKNTISTIY